jgi:predicted AAA+ superfamily ATPase
MIDREITERIKLLATKFPVIAVTGPRQSGKTTLVKNIFPEHTYINLEDIEKRNFATQDPKGFFAVYKTKIIIDEVQYVPELFSYIQLFADEQQIMGNFILTGSQNFLLMEKITQSLAGRVAMFTLLPFSYSELKNAGTDFPEYENYLLNGFYPPVYDRNIEPADWYPNYINTYIERDLHQIINVGDLYKFRQFIKICAGNIGQLVNFSGIGNDIGVSHNTIKKWISVLVESYIIYILPPYFKNFNKRVVKSPKLYFVDVGLACNLLGIKTLNDLSFHFMKGPIFENFVILELLKQKLNKQPDAELFFFRDNNKIEVDCLIETGGKITTVEIKSGRTLNTDFFKNLNKMTHLIENIKKTYLIYGGSETQLRGVTEAAGWRKLADIEI